MPKPRQKEIYTGSCDHLLVEDVMSMADVAIARRCKTCTKIMGPIAECHGCKRVRCLQFFLKSKRQNYCTEDCYRQVKAKERAEKAKEKL